MFKVDAASRIGRFCQGFTLAEDHIEIRDSQVGLRGRVAASVLRSLPRWKQRDDEWRYVVRRLAGTVEVWLSGQTSRRRLAATTQGNEHSENHDLLLPFMVEEGTWPAVTRHRFTP
ncbi:MAG: hypothetical protein ACYCV7_14275 [Acidimicrobiales bacterium]